MNNLLNSDDLTARFMREFGVKNLSYVSDLDTWARDGIYDMRIPNYYTITATDVVVTASKAPIVTPSDMVSGLFYFSALPFKIEGSYELIVRNDNNLGTAGLSTLGSMYATINGGFINIRNTTGYIRIYSKTVPIDGLGRALIPNNSKVIRALMYYFIYRMALSGHVHPVVDFKMALQLWEKEYPAAGNDASWFSEAELEAFTEMWTNPLIGDFARNNYIG